MKLRVRFLPQAFAIGTMLAVAGCHVQVDKGTNGQDKSVRIDTPLGGLHVRSGQTTAADLGLPVYPGATLSTGNDGDQSANVNMGIGDFELRVKVVQYQTADSQEKVLAFYKKAMGQFGDVLECKGRRAVGSPTVTSEGLKCGEAGDHNVRVNGMPDKRSLTLLAGSKHHQHIVAFRKRDGGTSFSLIELQLPESVQKGFRTD